jgi:hypothetical protein
MAPVPEREKHLTAHAPDWNPRVALRERWRPMPTLTVAAATLPAPAGGMLGRAAPEV